MNVSLSFSQFSNTKTFLVIKPQPELVLKLFLNFGKFEPHSYKVVLIKKIVCRLVSIEHDSFCILTMYKMC